MKPSRSFAARAEKHDVTFLMLRHPTDYGKSTKTLEERWSIPRVGE